MKIKNPVFLLTMNKPVKYLVSNMKKKIQFLFLNFNFLLYENLIDLNYKTLALEVHNLEELFLNKISVSIEYIQTQELTFLAEYYLITALFCLTLFVLFSLKLIVNEKHYLLKFQYNNQLIFLLIFSLSCYLILICQQMNLSTLSLTSFNDTIYNDQLAIVAKLVIGISSLLYLIFITQYLKDQKLSNFEYYIILLTSIIGFFLLCNANDLITAYLAIELQGLAFYVLASFKKSSNFSIESGVKYFVLGSLSTAIFLLGITFIYGLSGSIYLTDFKDFFIWVFSINSFFLSFDSIYKALESFQEKINLTDNSDLTKLKAISDKLDLFKNKAYILTSDISTIKPSYDSFNEKSNLEEYYQQYGNISERIFGFYSNLDKSNYFFYQDRLDSVSKNFFDVLEVKSLTNDFLLETFLNDMSLKLWDKLQKDSLDLNSCISLKNSILEAGSYEEENYLFESALNENLKSSPSSISQINKNILFDNSILNILNSLQCALLTSNQEQLNFIDSETDFNSVLPLSNLVTLSEKINYSYYILSVTDTLNISEFLLEIFNETNSDYFFMFDFSFVVFGMLIILFALFFKLALAPFHLWAPDVYEGSPTSSTFFFIVISKFSIFIFLLRICYLSFYSLISYWQYYSLMIATISIFIGAFAGLKQRRLKSLLAYSSINNMGFVLLAFSTGGFEGIQIKFFYLVVYIISSLCIWAIILNLKLKKKIYFEKQNKDLGDLALLNESNSIIAQNLAFTLFTLAGLPPMIGFLAKMGVFKALTGVSIYFFAVINILFSVIATFYYIRIVKIIFFENLLIGNLYETINTKKTFFINFLAFLLVFLFVSPMLLYFYSYKVTLFLNKSFY